MTDEGFTDPGGVLATFAGDVLVVCPACRACAHVIVWPPGTGGWTICTARRLVCAACGHTRDWPGGAVLSGDAVDPWFRQPLWLRAPVGRHTLWAYNHDHLDLLEQFVAATQRRRPTDPPVTPTLISRLPGWIKAARHRGPVLTAINGLLQSGTAPAGGQAGV